MADQPPSEPPAPKARGRAAALMQRLAAGSTSRPATAGPQSRPESRVEQATSPTLPSEPAPLRTQPSVSLAEAISRVAAEDKAAGRTERPRREPRQEIPRPPKKFNEDPNRQVFATEVNYLRVDCDLPDGGLCQHHVSFDPDVENFRIRMQALKDPAFSARIGPVSNFDGGSVLFLPLKIDPPAEIHMKHPINGQPLTVKVQFTNIVAMGNLMSFFNGIIKQLMDSLKWVKIGRDNHYYNPTVRHELRQHLLEIWPGFATSCKRAQDGGLIVEMDVSSHVLRSETVLDAFARTMRETRQGANFKDECTRAVLNEVVSTRYNNRTYKIEDIDWDKNPLSTFEQSNGNTISFMDYYRTQHGIVLKDARQPLLVSKLKAGRWGGTRGRGGRGGRGGGGRGGPEPVERTVLLVPELCYLTGLAESQRSNFNLMRDVGEFTRLTPMQRVNAIRAFLRDVQQTPECQRVLKQWRLSMSLDLVKVDGHLFAPETIFTGGRSADEPERCDQYDQGDFSNHINRATPLVTVPIRQWVLMYAQNARREADEFVQLVMQTSRQVSVQVDPPVTQIVASPRATDYVQAIRAVAGRQPFIVCILSSRSDEHYAAVKRECNAHGLGSQCIIAKTLGNPKKVTSICRRIFLQIEAKLGGELWGMSMPPAGLMVVGLDVYHDPGRKNPSWVALVGSINQQQTRYYSVACRQMPGEEAAHGVAMGFNKLITAYRQVNNCLPKKIIIFRDGLSASQFRMSQEFEIKQMRQVFQSLSTDDKSEYKPEFVFIVCVKRIGVRIFSPHGPVGGRPQSRGGQRGGEEGNYANPPPGTAIDRVVGEPNWYDFYLVSQAVRQGAVSPTHYVVIEDTSKYTASQVQRLCWKFTHLYYNWPGTVRSPAPVVYADRLAGMVGQVLLTEPHQNLRDKLFYL